MKKNKLYYIQNLIKRYPKLINIQENLLSAINALINSTRKGGKYLICGNGGSASDSNHIVGELMKGFLLKRNINTQLQLKLKEEYPEDADYFIENLQEGIRSMSLVSNDALISAFSNDKAPDLIYAQQVLGYGDKDDILVAISTSGNSRNVLYAAKIAKSLGMKVISLTGKNGGELMKISDIVINVSESETYKVQELHLPIYHSICLAIEAELFSE